MIIGKFELGQVFATPGTLEAFKILAKHLSISWSITPAAIEATRREFSLSPTINRTLEMRIVGWKFRELAPIYFTTWMRRRLKNLAGTFHVLDSTLAL